MTQAKFKIGGIEYAFNEITLRAYYTIQEIAKKGKQKKQDEFEIVEAITNCPVKELKKLSYQDWLIIWEEALFRINSISGGTEDIKPMFELNGVTYALPDVDKISIGEFADLEIILASPNSSTRLNEVAAVLYRKVVKKIGKKHIIEDYDTDGFNERSELFLDMPLSGIRSANAFFLHSVQQSLKSTTEFLMKETREMKSLHPEKKQEMEKILTELQESGGPLSTLWLDQILLDLTNHQSSQSAQHLTGLRGKKMNIVSRFTNLKNKLIK
jgi:hypothetical protein